MALVKEKVRINASLAGGDNEGCYSCGCHSHDKAGDYVFRYGVQAERLGVPVPNTTRWKKGVFCGVNCYRAYHE